MLELKSAVLDIAADVMEFRDMGAGGHAARTRKYLELLIQTMRAERVYYAEVVSWNLDLLLASSRLHDIGKIAVSDAVLNKPDKLTREEFEKMKTHVPIGVAIIERIEKSTGGNAFLNHAKYITATHHEKWDGTGYPYMLQKREIPLEGRLMAIADVYDALTSRRPYKEPIPTGEAEEIIVQGEGTHFDPALVEVFRLVSAQFADIVDDELTARDDDDRRILTG
ncbi:MAG: HD domain-containing protein [Azoarcus sp.]|nr:HD domain-containing protein [Azoarcus sp.]